MISSCHNSEIITTFEHQNELHRKMMTRKIGSGSLNEIREVELDYMEPDYMRIKGHQRDHSFSSNLTVVVKFHMMLFDIVEIVKRKFMSLNMFISTFIH